jgi:hypothetical protein
MRVLADPRLDELMKLNDPMGLYAYCLNCARSDER